MTGQEIKTTIDSIMDEMLRELNKGDQPYWRHDAVNWGDLSCVDVVETKSLLYPDDSFIEALIEEADPDSGNFCNEVSIRLKEKTGLDIIIRAEW